MRSPIEQRELAAHVVDDRLVHRVAGDSQAGGRDDAAQREDRHLGRAAADVDHHRPGRLVDRQAGTDRRRHRLADDVHPPRAGGVGGLADRALLDGGDAAGHADHDPRPGERAAAAQHLAHEVAQHLRGDVVVGDDAVLQRPHRHDVPRRPADHPLGLDPDRHYGVGCGVDRDHRRLVEHDAPAARIYQRVRRPEIDRQITAEQVTAALGHQREPSQRGERHE